jgi:cytochrome c biogenesis ATP-binding export protein ccmA
MDDSFLPLVKVDALTVEREGHIVLGHINLILEGGHSYGLVGPNGSGKSTLMHVIADLIPYQGKVQRPQRVALLTSSQGHHQRRRLTDHLSILSRRSDIDVKRLPGILQTLQLAHLIHHSPRTMSLGQYRAIGLVGIFASKAPVLLLDEPFLALDSERVAGLESLINRSASEGKVVLISSHEFDPLAKVIDSLIVLQSGNVKYFGDSHSFLVRSGQIQVIVAPIDLEKFRSTVEREWSLNLEVDGSGMLRFPNRSMEEILRFCFRWNLPIRGIWEYGPDLRGALTAAGLHNGTVYE